jgi:7,8-dihydro-6-hydroxymethylpterin-pyrophosphokinase
VRWGPRTLDVDVVAVDDVASDDPELTLPHPRAAERAFVLVPWLAVDPNAVLAGRPVRDLVAGLSDGDVRLRSDLAVA